MLSSTTDRRIFSNVNVGSGGAVELLERGKQVDPRRYNGEFIDTRHRFRGRDYNVCLRALCVGRVPVAFYPRARPAEEGLSVHAKDTPLDADLLNYLYRALVEPNIDRLSAICAKVAECLGLCFFAHDILPERGTSRLLLCEAGYKFDDMTLRRHLAPNITS
jgi:hypothetical protein